MARKGGRDRGLFEHPKGSGQWWIEYHDAGGQRHREKVGRKGLARRRYMQRKTEIAEARFFPEATRRATLFDDLLEEYRQTKRREHKAVMATDSGYRRLLDRFGGRRADTLTAAEIDEWRDQLRESMSPATVNLHLTILRAALRLALRNQRIKPSELPVIKALKVNNVHVRYLTDEEESRLLEVAPDWLKPLVTVAIHTGMRRGELLRLTWADVDFVSGTIFVRVSKSGEGRRIPMSATAHRTLATLRDARRERMRERVVAQREAAGTVFTAPAGGLIMNLGRVWYQVLERAGIEGLRFHDLRHTFASRLAMKGADLYRVQTLMGHKTPAMTLRYAHLSPDHLRAAVALLDAPGPKPWAANKQSITLEA